MSKLIAGMTMSLDGFVSDSHFNASKLYPDFEELADSDYMRAIIAETGAVLMGRRSFDAAGDTDTYADTYEFQVPIFVLTHHPPETMPKQNENLTITFVTEGIESAVARARTAAGNRAVTVVGGARLIQELLLAGFVDELSIDIMPVLLGAGTRLFDVPALENIRLETIDVQRVGQRIVTRFRVLKDA